MDLLVFANGRAIWQGRDFRCAVGRGGIVGDKREGDGKTPKGRWSMRWLYYRPDREPLPATHLSRRPLARADGWCDAPDDPRYNCPVVLPYPASAERLWRDDPLYDLIVPLGYNDGPVTAGAGSAIFLHIAGDDFAPTAGCVALRRDDLLAILAEADSTSAVVVRSMDLADNGG